MRTAPGDIDPEEIADLLDREWGLRVGRLDHLPEGAGAHHWVATAHDQQRWLVTGDDLETKPWLGSDRVSVLTGLRAAYRTAAQLRGRAGLEFVVAPVVNRSGEVAVPLGPRYSLALFPFVEGEAGHWGEPIDPASRTRLVGLLAQLHRSTGATAAVPVLPVEIPGRRPFEEALARLDQRWEGGPFSESTRQALARSAAVVAGWFSDFDGRASRLAASPFEPVITHGEPHPGNLISTANGVALVDWDTVALDRPERDLWMLDDGEGSVQAAYEELTGRAVDQGAVDLFRLRWTLSDLAAYTVQLRAPHEENADTEKAAREIGRLLARAEPAPYGRPSIRPS